LLLLGAATLVAGRGRASLHRITPTSDRPGGGDLRRRVSAGVGHGAEMLCGRPGRLVLAAAAAGLGATAGPVPAALAALAAPAALGAALRWRAERRAGAAMAEATEAIDALVAELRSGKTPSACLRSVATQAPAAGQLLGRAAAAAELGGDVPAALRGVGPGGHRLAAGWEVAERAGAPLADVLDRLAADQHASLQLAGRQRAELAGARSTAWVLAALPLLGLALGQSLGAAPLTVLLHTPVGGACAVTGAVLELAGLAWVRRLTAAAEPTS
jgi:tight adherence protein B